MSTQTRRERERAERERAIIAAARDLALAEGWDAVTTRRLAAEIEYSQPVLYSHFRGKREIIGAVAELARYGVGGRNLRVFRSSADREANLLQQILAPALRSRNPQRRKEAEEALENLAAVATHLKHLLLVRDLRKILR